MKTIFVVLVVGSLSLAAVAKLPAPTDEAKAKAAEAAAKTAHTGKVDGYLLCKSQDKVASQYLKTSKSVGKEPKPAVAVPACADPGPFVYTPATVAMATASVPVGAASNPATQSPAAGKDGKKI